MASTEVEDLYRRLQTFQLQLKVILDRNNEVLSHLEQVEASITGLDSSVVNKDAIRGSIKVCRVSSKQVQEIAESQCGSLEGQIRELARYSDDDLHGDINRVPDTTFSSVKQQLMSQLDYNVALQKDKAALETRLAEKLEKLAQVNKMNETLQGDVEESQEKMRSVLERLDKTAKDAEDRLDCLEKETKKAQKASEEYQRLYEAEKQRVEHYEKERGENRNPAKRRQASTSSHRDLTAMARQTRTSSTTPYLFQAPMTRVKSADRVRPKDMDTKYLCLVDKNRSLHMEVRRLRDENAHLMRSSKDSKRDVEIIQRYIATCQTQRNELQVRLRREQEEHRRLATSMNKQASNWISEKKMVRGMETTSKTAKIQSESVLGASRRLKLHSVKLNEDKPRDIPVQSW
ncbi:E3 ubiquitin-protein ligase BRE1A-like [Acanthaster planci]|uniref:E3 ubiquitin-protein ligase BRE1A-like n=1 Tax=Acanthaster planci TaxID=133434 RepID=A0A8B7Z3F3_ACAPL|nr:E3 ubiquitin-protein ligase BRE1A-like [Acanthaster planci]